LSDNVGVEGAESLPGLGGSLAVSLVSLGVVCLIAYLSLRLLSQRGVGRGSGPVRVLARCPLEPRRSVYLIEAAGRCFLVGVGDGPMTVLAELNASEMAKVEATTEPGIRFADVLARVLGRRAGSGPPP
jgi:flagellar biosynthetic protein FliO